MLVGLRENYCHLMRFPTLYNKNRKHPKPPPRKAHQEGQTGAVLCDCSTIRFEPVEALHLQSLAANVCPAGRQHM